MKTLLTFSAGAILCALVILPQPKLATAHRAAAPRLQPMAVRATALHDGNSVSLPQWTPAPAPDGTRRAMWHSSLEEKPFRAAGSREWSRVP